MTAVLIVLGYILFVLVLVGGVVASMLSLPGTVLILVNGIVISACTHWERPGVWVLLVLGVLCLLAELGDNVLSMVGTRYGGGSSSSGWVALLGGLAGALLGSLVSPVFSAIGVLGGAVGFVVGVVVVPLGLAVTGGYYAVYWYEQRHGKTPEEAALAAKGALFGRLLGTMGKTLIAAIMSGILLWTVFVPLMRQ